MNSTSHVTEAAQQIADELEPDWSTVSDAPQLLPGLQLLHDIASSFRAGDEPAPEPVLFEHAQAGLGYHSGNLG